MIDPSFPAQRFRWARVGDRRPGNRDGIFRRAISSQRTFALLYANDGAGLTAILSRIRALAAKETTSVSSTEAPLK